MLNRRGYSLLELLICILIIAILIAIVIPTLSKIRYSARNAICLSNQRQLFVYASVYINNGGYFDVNVEDHSFNENDSYFLDCQSKIIKCPEDKTGNYSSYFINRGALNSLSMRYNPEHSNQDSSYDHKVFVDMDYWHDGYANAVYLNGKTITFKE